jgi:DNA repair ATPase RecN
MAILFTKLELSADEMGKLYGISRKYNLTHDQLVTEIMRRWLELDDIKQLETEYEKLYRKPC